MTTTTAAPAIDAPLVTDVEALEAAFSAPSARPARTGADETAPARAKWAPAELLAGALFATLGLGMVAVFVLAITG